MESVAVHISVTRKLEIGCGEGRGSFGNIARLVVPLGNHGFGRSERKGNGEMETCLWVGAVAAGEKATVAPRLSSPKRPCVHRQIMWVKVHPQSLSPRSPR